MIEQAVGAKLQELLVEHSGRRKADSNAGVVLNGYLPELSNQFILLLMCHLILALAPDEWLVRNRWTLGYRIPETDIFEVIDTVCCVGVIHWLAISRHIQSQALTSTLTGL